jgi:DNA-binding MarR family transcriptional regulator
MDAKNTIGVEFTRLALWNHRLERILGEEEELPVNQLHCVMALYIERPSSARELARRLGILDTSLSKILRCLQERGAVEREPDKIDRRIERVSLTRSGERTAQRLIAGAGEIGCQLLSGLPEDRREQFMRCLGVITASNAVDCGKLSGSDE